MYMQTNLRLKVPYKTTEPVDLEKNLSCFIKEKYSEEVWNEHKDAVRALDVLRTSALCKISAKNEPNFEYVSHYYLILRKLQPVLSSFEDQFFSRVTWYDYISKYGYFQRNCAHHFLISFEVANVLFLLGTAAINGGYKHETIREEDAKTLIKYFQLAAGLFTELGKLMATEKFAQDMLDLQPEWTEAFASLALGEAQMGFVIKVCNEPGRDVQLAKMYSGAANHFKEALFRLKSLEKSSFQKELMRLMNIKFLLSSACAHKHQSKVEESLGKYDLKLGHIKIARDRASDYHGMLTNDATKKFLAEVESLYTAAVKENEMIYHAVAPDSSAIPQIPSLVVAKALAPTAENLLGKKSFPGSDYFSHLVTSGVRNATNLFLVRFKDAKTNCIRSIDEANQILDSLAAEMNLPACLEKVEANSLPVSISEKINSVIATGGLRALQVNMGLLEEARTRNFHIIRDMESSLRKEEERDSQFRKTYHSQWQCQPSAEGNRKWKDSLSKHNELMKTAFDSDNLLTQKLSEIKPLLELMCGGVSKMAALVAGKNDVITRLGSAFKHQLAALYSQMRATKDERSRLLSELKVKDSEVQEHFMGLLSSEGSMQTESECEKYLRTFDPQFECIKKSVESQDSLVQALITAVEKVRDSAAGHTNNTLDKVLLAFNTYQYIRAGIQEGIDFYNRLTLNLTSLQTKINDFCYARELEGKELLQYINSRASVATNSPYNPHNSHYPSAHYPRQPPQAPTYNAYPPSAPPNPYTQPRYSNNQQYSTSNSSYNPYHYGR